MVRAARANWRSFLLPLGLMASAGARPLAAQATHQPHRGAPRRGTGAKRPARDRHRNAERATSPRAPDDGSAWIQLGRFYLLDIRDWHLSGHPAESPGPLYIDFGAAALDQAVRLRGDTRRGAASHAGGRARPRRGRGERVRRASPSGRCRPTSPPLPDFIFELGANLLSSCPTTGVMATGSDLETVAIFSVIAAAGQAASVIIVVPSYYATDARYRNRIATALGTDSSWSVQRALAAVSQRRPVCLTPLADRALLALAGAPARCASCS